MGLIPDDKSPVLFLGLPVSLSLNFVIRFDTPKGLDLKMLSFYMLD